MFQNHLFHWWNENPETLSHLRDHLRAGGLGLIQLTWSYVLTCWTNPCQCRKFHKVHVVKVYSRHISSIQCLWYNNIYNVSIKAVGILHRSFLWYSQSNGSCKFSGGLHVRLPKACWCVKKSRMRPRSFLTRIGYSPSNCQETISKIVYYSSERSLCLKNWRNKSSIYGPTCLAKIEGF